MDDTNCEIRIQVATNYVDEQSEPEDGRYVFAYTITISNEGDIPAQLISRHWVITDADGDVEEVRGQGVVGEQPVLAPGERFEYASGCALSTSVGTMHGSYQMVAAGGDEFEAVIAPFSLAVPTALN